MKSARLMTALAAVVVSVGLSAQGRNFAGVWTIDSEKTMAANGAAGGGGGARGASRALRAREQPWHSATPRRCKSGSISTS